MGHRVALAALAAVAAFVAAGAARADNPMLVADVGLDDSYTITVSDAGGNRVTHLDPGTYTLTVRDHSSFHNFHLAGPGVDVATGIDSAGTQTFTVTLGDGTYLFMCDPHNDRMRGTFTVGSVASPPPPAPKPAAAKLAASIGPGAKVALAPRSGLSAGKAVVTVRDRSATDGFRLSGPGLTRATGAAFRGTVRWTVTLKAGRYVWGSIRTPKLRHTLRVSS